MYLYKFGVALSPIGDTGFGYAIAPNGAIRSAYRPIGKADTGSLSPYLAIAQYGLFIALFRPLGSIRALCSGYVLAARAACAHTPPPSRYWLCQYARHF